MGSPLKLLKSQTVVLGFGLGLATPNPETLNPKPCPGVSD